jgi:hypothetical protein
MDCGVPFGPHGPEWFFLARNSRELRVVDDKKAVVHRFAIP